MITGLKRLNLMLIAKAIKHLLMPAAPALLTRLPIPMPMASKEH
jgi:hypothetical protein